MVANMECIAAEELELARSDQVGPWGMGGQPRLCLNGGHEGGPCGMWGGQQQLGAVGSNA